MTILFLFDFGFSFSILVTRVFLNSLDTNLVDMSIYQFWVWYVPESRKIFSKFLSSDQEKGFYHLHASFIFRKYKWHCHNFRGFFFLHKRANSITQWLVATMYIIYMLAKIQFILKYFVCIANFLPFLTGCMWDLVMTWLQKLDVLIWICNWKEKIETA